MSATPSRGTIPAVATLVIVLDQITKALLVSRVSLHAEVPIVDGLLALTHVHNRGMAFGLFSDVGGAWLRWILVAVALGAVAIIWSYARQESGRLSVMIAFGAILGGAAGNLIDRLRHGYVIDFILAHWGRYEWPAFNVADSAITIGGAMLFFALAREHGEADASDDSSVTGDPASVSSAAPPDRD